MKLKRVLAAVLACTMVFGATGCMKKSGSGKSKEARKEVAVPDDIWTPYEEEVELHVVMRENVAIKWAEGDNYDNNPWYREFKDRFNIQVVNDWVSNDYATKLNLSIAEGDLPDVCVVNAEQMKQLQEADMIWDLTDVYESQASDTVRDYMSKDPATFETAKIGGKLYGIPQMSIGPIDQMNTLWVKKDWKEEAGVEDISTMENFEKMAKAIQAKHGKYAITETDSLMSFFAMATGWGASPEIWVEQEDGTIGYGSIQPEMKTALETYARWYSEEMIDPEFTITDGDKMFQKVLNEEVGISPFSSWFVWGVGPGSIAQWGVDGSFDSYPIPTATEEAAKAAIKFDNYGYIVVSKKCPNPDAALRLINFYAYLKDGDSQKEDPELIKALFNLGTIPASFRVFSQDAEYNKYKNIAVALESGNADGLVADTLENYNKCKMVMDNNDSTGGGEYLLYGRDKCCCKVTADMVDNNLMVKDKLWGTPTETLAKSGSTLDDILVEGFTKIIVGEEPVEYFDTLVENWKKAGGEQATKEVNEVYGK